MNMVESAGSGLRDMTPESFSKRYAAFVEHINNITEKRTQTSP
jgi:hypothetical protein